MNCGACGARGTIENDRCTACGAEQRRYRMPMRREKAPAPAIWQKAAPVVARGVALVAAGFVGEWLFRSAAKKAVQAPFAGGRKTRAIASKDDETLPKGAVAVSETIVMRRVIYRR